MAHFSVEEQQRSLQSLVEAAFRGSPFPVLVSAMWFSWPQLRAGTESISTSKLTPLRSGSALSSQQHNLWKIKFFFFFISTLCCGSITKDWLSRPETWSDHQLCRLVQLWCNWWLWKALYISQWTHTTARVVCAPMVMHSPFSYSYRRDLRNWQGEWNSSICLYLC